MSEPPQVILASSSPRRRELLAGLGLSFRIIVPDVEEIPEPIETAEAFARRAARDKARRVAGLADGAGPSVVIGGDTVVVLDGRILGKPRDAAEARDMLQALSGRTHQVVTGVCVLAESRENVFSVTSDVTFKRLSEREIEDYVATGEPMDKAGAYAVQGLGAAMVAAVRGSYSNVVGLPVEELKQTLTRDFGVAFTTSAPGGPHTAPETGSP